MGGISLASTYVACSIDLAITLSRLRPSSPFHGRYLLERKGRPGFQQVRWEAETGLVEFVAGYN